MDYWMSTKSMVLPHSFDTYPESVKKYFVESFQEVGFTVTENNLIKKRKTFEEWLIDYELNSKNF
jgi:hypothetical protein